MSALEPDIQWFIARDGRQHGPLSDAEMKKLVELGHLRQTDLVWRLGFPDWRPVPAVFPSPAQPAPTPAPAAPAWSSPAPPAESKWQPQVADVGIPAAARSERTGGRPAGFEPMGMPSHQVVSLDEAARRPVQSVAGAVGPGSSKSRHRLLVAAAMLAVVAGGAWLGYQNRTEIASYTSVPAKAPDEPPASEAGQSSKAAFETAAVPADDGTAALDSEFQKRPAWSAVKQEFPEWYEGRLKEAARLEKEGKPDAEITRHLVESLVGLRRQHADQALAASTAKHKDLAAAFLENLKNLSKDGPESCYEFISKGETSPAVISLMQDAQKSAAIEAQVVAIVAAIAEGRKAPVAHASPVKADYDMLAAELNRLGWTQADMQLFADSKALARAPRERVCKMVQDWFTAHLAITDAATQERLLFETLRPVVAG